MSSGLSLVLDAIAPTLRLRVFDGQFVASRSSTAPTIASFALENRTTLVITTTDHEARALVGELRSWLPDRDCQLWPAWDTHPLERVSPDIDVMAQRALVRYRVEQGPAPEVIVSSLRAVLQHLPPGPAMAPLIIRRGESYDRDELVGQLVRVGYRREHEVEHRGEFSVRGGIVDVWSGQDDEPVRLDFFGDELERLGFFDVATQRMRDVVEHVTLTPVREWVPDESVRERARQLATRRPWASAVLHQIADGQLFDGVENWMSLLDESPRTLVDVGAFEQIFVTEPARVAQRAEEIASEEAALVEGISQTWNATGAIPGLHAPVEVVWSQPRLVALHSRVGDDSLAMSSPPLLHGQLERLADEVARWDPRRRGVIVSSSRAGVERIEGLLAQLGLPHTTNPLMTLDISLTVLEGTLETGFQLDEPPITVWSEHDFTGRQSPHRAPRARTRQTDGFFNDLAIGSYVVHRHYGVAKFSGTTTREINGVVRDYLILEFKDGRSYWPTEQIEALTPYAGGDAPTLSRMGSAEWQKTRAKARAAAYLVAQELVELYRQRAVAPGFAFSPDSDWQREMEELFPYTLTADQARAIEDVKADMESPRPMDRLVCADVGFGKTEIAVRAIFKAVQDQKQVALLVPTTLLASQHFGVLRDRFAGFPVRVALLSRFVDDREARETLDGLRDGTVDVVVGTHRLLSEQVAFRDLGLLVVDEEQRFGVDHKEAIKARAVGVDVLTLSASPIPRTLEMAFTGIRDLSMVTTPPSDRRPILTHVGPNDDAAVTEAIRRELLREGQVFYVHNRVSDIDRVAARIQTLVPDARIAVAHGQMDEGRLERIMMDFGEHGYDVLVCTTIVESGIDLPSVNTLIVDQAHRLGLGQLHQLRGRVGRSGQRAYAYLFYPADREVSEVAYERLRTIGDNSSLGSGFKIAMRDLEIRGAGNLLGRHQSGPVAAVGYDLYVQLVAEAVADAKGTPLVAMATVTLDVPGDAHLPKEYVEAEDARLEAYRRLSLVRSGDELEDLRNEWRDRYGPLPQAAEGLIDLGALRLFCLALDITSVQVLPPRPGVRDSHVARISPWRRADGTSGELQLALSVEECSPRGIIGRLESISTSNSDASD